MQVAIDGPSGAGKSTVSRACAKELGYIYIDTGALYRAVALFGKRNGVTVADGIVPLLPQIKLDVYPGEGGGEQRIVLNGDDVTQAIRDNDISLIASRVSAVPAVREFLLNTQRGLASRSDCIMDGRDIGSVVLPNADVKIYLTATAETRTRRRLLELTQKGDPLAEADGAFDTLLAQINKRDSDDMNREIAPLTQCDDAVLIETDDLDFAGTVAAVAELVRGRK